jgi:type IV pilus assembly protein PilV
VRPHPRVQAGFSLLEALIALVIIMIGLLGVAGLQALGIHSGAQAHLRTLAALDAHSLAAAMRANRAYWANPAAPAKITIAAPPEGTTATLTGGIATGADCAAATCTAAQTAGYNLARWGSQLAALQHGASAEIERIAAAGTSAYAYKVTVTWSERRMRGQGVEKRGAKHSTSVVVQP